MLADSPVSALSVRAPRGVSRRLRELVELGVLIALAVFVGSTWFVGRFQIQGGSMAPTLLGTHWQVVCAECGRRFTVGRETPPDDFRRAVCPQCGDNTWRFDRLPIVPGEQVLVHRSIYACRAPRRWELAVFRGVEHPQERIIKRIVGLPGETISIRGGELFVDGTLVRKPLEVQQSLAILVHDAASVAKPDVPLGSGWRPERHDSRWQHAETLRWSCDAREADSDDWLVFEHHARSAGDRRQTTPAPITDLDAYNQLHSFPGSRFVDDLLLQCGLRIDGQGGATIRARHSGGIIELRLGMGSTPDRLVDVSDGDRELTLAESRAGSLIVGRLHELVLSLVDHQVLVTIDGREVLRWLDPGMPTLAPTPRPLAIKGTRGRVELVHPRVFRDVIYGEPSGPWPGVGFQTPYRLGPDEYYVLGDNSPLSHDSRYLEFGPTVSRNQLLGKPLAVWWPTRPATVLGRRIQVPATTRFRYIH